MAADQRQKGSAGWKKACGTHLELDRLDAMPVTCKKLEF
jgi:hypothetical protein